MRHRRDRGWQRTAASASLTLAVLAAGCDRTADDRVDAVAQAGPTAPDRDASLGDAGWPETAAWIRREAEAGRPTVVNLFASWCGPCREEAPVLRRAIAAHPDVAFLGVDHLDRRPAGEAFLEEEDLDFDATLFDVTGDVAANIGARGMPTTAFFDATGRLVSLHTGPITDDVMTARLRQAGVAR